MFSFLEGDAIQGRSFHDFLFIYSSMILYFGFRTIAVPLIVGFGQLKKKCVCVCVVVGGCVKYVGMGICTLGVGGYM